ncbi:MAG: sarcosine oxidase subunit gamma [Steroidobacteraceae bacterium]
MPDKIATLMPQSSMPAGGRVFSDTLRLTVLPARTVIQLRFAGQAPKGIGTLKIAGRPVPQAMNTWRGDDPVICRIAPDTWLLLSALHEAPELLDAVRTACRRKPCAIADLSDAYVTLALDGSRAAAVLARGCGIDFAPSAFGTDACTRTRLAQLPVVVRRATADRFECVVDRSTAQYLFDWMQDAAAGLD